MAGPLVVIAIIGVLVALLLPAVQAAREAPRRLQCAGHARDMALAMNTYESAHGQYPGGAHVALANGSVHLVSEVVAHDVFKALGSANGGESFSVENLR